MVRRHSEVSAWLSLVLTTADLLLIFVLQKLATVLSDREQMRVSQGALLKQVPILAVRAKALMWQKACTSSWVPLHLGV